MAYETKAGAAPEQRAHGPAGISGPRLAADIFPRIVAVHDQKTAAAGTCPAATNWRFAGRVPIAASVGRVFGGDHAAALVQFLGDAIRLVLGRTVRLKPQSIHHRG